jgi:hypothetical protein
MCAQLTARFIHRKDFRPKVTKHASWLLISFFQGQSCFFGICDTSFSTVVLMQPACLNWLLQKSPSCGVGNVIDQ